MRVVAGNDEAVRDESVRGWVVVVLRGIEIVETPVLFRQAAVVVKAQANRDAQIGTKLEFVLNVLRPFHWRAVTVGIALQDVRG